MDDMCHGDSAKIVIGPQKYVTSDVPLIESKSSMADVKNVVRNISLICLWEATLDIRNNQS